MTRSNRPASLLLVLAMAASLSAQAQIFKCVDPDGNVSFRDSPCPKDARSEAIEIAQDGPGATRASMTLERMIAAGPIDALTRAQPLLAAARDDAATCRAHVEAMRDMQLPACRRTREAQRFIGDYADYASMIVNREVAYDMAIRPEIDRIGMANRRIVDRFNESVLAINELLARR